MPKKSITQAEATRQFASLTDGLTGGYQVVLVDADEPLEVDVIGADLLRWEQVTKGSFFSGEVGLSRIVWIVWAAARRQRKTTDEVAEFMAKVVEIRTEDNRPPAAEEDTEADEYGVPLPDPTEAGITA